MQSLYVCIFSNGHIKVGRSDKPFLRIATHADRVSCLGVTVVDQQVFECVGRASLAEAELIRRCAEAASKRNAVEWFEGLHFEIVCAWAMELAATRKFITALSADKDGGMRKIDAIRALGGTPKRAAEAMGYVSAHAVYMWPDVLRQSVAERVAGIVAARACEEAKPTPAPAEAKKAAHG
jgi:hypothetical protein